MNQYIAYCGLDCEACEARLATVRNDDALRRQVAEKWSALNGADITPDMIHCVGCRLEGPKTPYCEALCPIRPCAQARKMETCGGCAEKEACEKLGMILAGSPQARANLGMKAAT